MDLGFEIWDASKTSYTAPTTSPIDASGKKISENNAKDMKAILGGLEESEFVNIMHCKSTKYMWTRYKIYMKGMTGSKNQNCRPIEDNLRALK